MITLTAILTKITKLCEAKPREWTLSASMTEQHIARPRQKGDKGVHVIEIDNYIEVLRMNKLLAQVCAELEKLLGESSWNGECGDCESRENFKDEIKDRIAKLLQGAV